MKGKEKVRFPRCPSGSGVKESPPTKNNITRSFWPRWFVGNYYKKAYDPLRAYYVEIKSPTTQQEHAKGLFIL